MRVRSIWTYKPGEPVPPELANRGWTARLIPPTDDPSVDRAATSSSADATPPSGLRPAGDHGHQARPASAEDAARAAREHLVAYLDRAPTDTREWFARKFGSSPALDVVDGALEPPFAPTLRWASLEPRTPLPPLAETWVVYVRPVLLMIESSTVLLVQKADGAVVYFGSANDEG